MAELKTWRFAIDVGGTFTDCVGIDPDGQQHFAKVLSQGPAPITAIRQCLKLPDDQPLPPVDVRLGTTRGTNALLTRTGANVCFVTTQGFADLLRIGFQNRPEIFAIDVRKPEQLFSQSLEINERIHFDGEVEKPLDPDEVRRQLQQVHEAGIQSLAVCLIHAYRFPQHEIEIAAIAREVGFEEISLSHVVAPEIRMIPRAYTTVLDAYLNPILRQYIAEIQSGLHPDSTLMMFSSSGALVPADRFTGKDSILSGPAGGVVGFSQAARRAGIDKSIGFDMGGTSTDVSRFDGQYNYQYESHKSGVYIVAPTLAIETVAAGGGSVCQFDGLRLQVGPQSAGADPGPACYGRGGPLALTDINLYLGRIDTTAFPFSLDRPAVEDRLTEIQRQMIDAGLPKRSLEWIAEGFLTIAVAKTAEAIRLISVRKGYDVSEYALVAFGGAAGQIACRVADELEIDRILIHPQAGILSAVGIGLAERIEHDSRGVYQLLSDVPHLDQLFSELESDHSELPAEFTRKIDVRYQGTDSWLTLTYTSRDRLIDQFQSEHKRLFGYLQDRSLEVGVLRLEIHHRHASFESFVPFVASSSSSFSTLVIDDGWTSEPLADGQTLLRRTAALPTATAAFTSIDQVQVELLNNRLFSIAEQMGEALRATAVSVNVKERLDFSCAIFDGQGNLLANAPHIPIHLGAMSECVKNLIADNPDMHPGDCLVTNDPYRGGSHLPDVTLLSWIAPPKSWIAPRSHASSTTSSVTVNNAAEADAEDALASATSAAESSAEGKLTPDSRWTAERSTTEAARSTTFYVASRAHHSEIGGKTPGSMPPDSTNLAEEGVLIQNFKLIDGQARTEHFAELRRLLTAAPYPSRQPEQNLSDIRAQIAANRMGQQALADLMAHSDPEILSQLIARIYQLAAAETRRVIRELERDTYDFEDYLDCGAKVAVRIERSLADPNDPRLTFDFSGSSPTLPNNLNANSAIVHSAVIYCLRLLIGQDIPLNQGILDPVEIVLPECFLNPTPAADPARSPAVVGGNVETSQRIVDVILGALEVAAASQGTTNNVIFGDETFGYYETVCGGGGASATSDGADAIQCHITNTRITDPEILETRYPVVLEEFSIREDSGGAGQHHGGNGVIRRLRFRRPLQLSVLCNRYGDYVPFGLHGGSAGSAGQLDFSPTHLDLRTPGGGGYGRK